MPIPKTSSFVDKNGNGFNSEEVIKGIIKTWGTESIVSQITAPVSAEAITDNDGKIIRYRYFKLSFGKIINRKTIVDQDRAGSVAGKNIVGSEIIVDIDDEKAIEPFYIENWDANKISKLVELKAAKEGEYSILPMIDRAEKYFEICRKVAKVAEAASLNDGVNRVIDTTAIKDDPEKLYNAYADAIVKMRKLKNSEHKGIPAEFMAVVMPPEDIKTLATWFIKTGAPTAKDDFENGVVTKINGVKVWESINTPGTKKSMGFIMIRGAAVLPLANAEIVELPSKSNSVKGTFEWATSKEGGVLYGHGIIALGDPTEINA